MQRILAITGAVLLGLIVIGWISWTTHTNVVFARADELAVVGQKANVMADLLKLKVDPADGVYSERLNGIETVVGQKADKTYVDRKLAKKANVRDMAAALDAKADKTYVVSALALKADQTAVDAALAKKASFGWVKTGFVAQADLPAPVDTSAFVMKNEAARLWTATDRQTERIERLEQTCKGGCRVQIDSVP